MPAGFLSRRAYARARGCSEHSIRKAIAAGRIKPTADDLIDPEQADENWFRWSRASLAHRRPRSSRPSSRSRTLWAAIGIERLRTTAAMAYAGDERAWQRLVDDLELAEAEWTVLLLIAGLMTGRDETEKAEADPVVLALIKQAAGDALQRLAEFDRDADRGDWLSYPQRPSPELRAFTRQHHLEHCLVG
jgi:hypothetical protein